MPRLGFEPTISAGERPKTYALDRAATGTGLLILFVLFHDCWNLQMCWIYGRAFEKCIHY